MHFDDAEEMAHIEELLAELGPASDDEAGNDGDDGADTFPSDSEEEEAMEV